MSLVSYQYAKAFFDLSVQKNALDIYKEELSVITGIYKKENKFQVFLSDPKINMEYKKQVLTNVFNNKISVYTLNFLLIILEKRRISLLPEIWDEFNNIFDKENNILNIHIISAMPLEQKQVELIGEKFKKLHNASFVNTLLEIDPSILGGIRVVIGDMLYDASLKEKLFNLRTEMHV